MLGQDSYKCVWLITGLFRVQEDLNSVSIKLACSVRTRRFQICVAGHGHLLIQECKRFCHIGHAILCVRDGNCIAGNVNLFVSIYVMWNTFMANVLDQKPTQDKFADKSDFLHLLQSFWG